jgi:hypothetical protein
MNFNLKRSLEILSATPDVLEKMLGGLSDDWLFANEGENTWSPHAVIGHLVYADETNWMARVRKTLSDHDNIFEPFNRLAQFELYGNVNIKDLLAKFSKVRSASLRELSKIDLNETMLARTGVHPEFGKVTLSQLLSTWTVHDLDHINQISRVLAKQYKEAVGPWTNYLGVIKRPI